jgi:hypothetical protein
VIKGATNAKTFSPMSMGITESISIAHGKDAFAFGAYG